MKYQQYNDAIYQMRQEILKDIREYASRLGLLSLLVHRFPDP